MNEEAADYIIVGAGSAGCVLANKLSQNPNNKVLLIEAGPEDNNLLLHIPRGFGAILGKPDYTWLFPVQRSFGANEPEFHFRGKTLGGTSAVNGMVYMRGLSSDYDDWNVPGWRWSDIKRCYIEMEDHELGATEFRGAGGPLKLTAHSYNIPICDAFLAAHNQIGVPTRADINESDAEGVGYHTRTVSKRGWRQSSATAFLKPARHRPNLRVLTNCEVDKVEFAGKRAIGVVARIQSGPPLRLRARREIILSAGGFNSPRLLQLSGIGDGAHLTSLGIDVVANNEEVGKNLIDHRMMPHQFSVSHGSQNPELGGARLYLNLIRQVLFGNGPLSFAAFEAGGNVKTDPALDRPNVQLLMGSFRTRREAKGIAMTKEPGINIGGYQMRPTSRGKLFIESADPKIPARVEPNFLDTEEDCNTAIALVRYIRRLAAQPAFAPFSLSEVYPGPELQTDEQILDQFRRLGGSAQHLSGVCRMGADKASVVDERLRVRGVDGLRVVDISIFPAPTSGNTNAPAMALAWRASDLILEDAR